MPKHLHQRQQASPLVLASTGSSQLSFCSVEDSPPNKKPLRRFLSRKKTANQRSHTITSMTALERASSPRKSKPSTLFKSESSSDDDSDEDDDDDDSEIKGGTRPTSERMLKNGMQNAIRPSNGAFSPDDESSSSSDEASTDEEQITATVPSNLRRKVTSDDDDDDDDELETPYAQAFDARRGVHGRRPVEPLRAGDVISYYHPAFVAGNPMGFRMAQILKITANKSSPLVLSNMECLGTDCYIARIREFRKGKLYPHQGLRKAIEDFKYRVGDELREDQRVFEDQLVRIQRILLEGKDAVEKGPPPETGNASSSSDDDDDDDDNDSSSEPSDAEESTKNSSTQRTKQLFSSDITQPSKPTPRSLQKPKLKEQTSKPNSVFSSDSESSTDILRPVTQKNSKRSSTLQATTTTQPKSSTQRFSVQSTTKSSSSQLSSTTKISTRGSDVNVSGRKKKKIRSGATSSSLEINQERRKVGDGVTLRKKSAKNKTKIIEDSDEDDDDAKILNSRDIFSHSKKPTRQMKSTIDDKDDSSFISLSSRKSATTKKKKHSSSVQSTPSFAKKVKRKLSIQPYVDGPSTDERDPEAQREQQRREYQNVLASSTNATTKRKGKRSKDVRSSSASQPRKTSRPTDSDIPESIPRKTKRKSVESASSSSLIKSIEDRTTNLCDSSGFDRQSKQRRRRQRNSVRESPLVQSTNRPRDDSMSNVSHRQPFNHFSQESISTYASERSNTTSYPRPPQQRQQHRKSSLELKLTNAQNHSRY